MLVKGHSGFEIQLIDASTIRKSTLGPQAERLARQIAKQALFHQDRTFKRILTPAILHMETEPNSFFAHMEFIAADDFVEFLSEAGREELDDFLDLLIEYLEHNLAHCQETDVSEPLRQKLNELTRKKVPVNFIEAARKLSAGKIMVPVGPCHGDLTLSNMLFKGRRIYLIDFLDGFVETPLQDIAKLRQDTFFNWSLHLYPAEFDATKIRLTMAYLDRGLHESFSRKTWYANHYSLFQLVNLMRILPYCRETSSTQLVSGCIDRLLSQIL